MKKFFLVLITLLLVAGCACADKTVNAVGVGSTTKALQYEVTDSGIDYWDMSGTKMIFAFVAIKNNDDKYIYMKDCNFEYEDDDGHLLDTATMVSTAPYVIAPGETGYFYVSSMNGGFLSEGVDLSKGLNLYAQFTLQESHEAVDSFGILDTSLDFTDFFGTKTPAVKGRIRNNTDKDYEGYTYINFILKDKDGKVVWIEGTNIDGLYAGATVGFSSEMMIVSPSVTEGTVDSFEVLAKPYYYQYN